MSLFTDPIVGIYIELQERFLIENRVDGVKKKFTNISTEHDEHAKLKNPGEIVDHFANSADPTKKKLYTEWAVGQYHKGNTKQEDVDRLHDTLSNFDKYKPKLEKKDIFQYGSVKDLETAIKPHLGAPVTRAEQEDHDTKTGRELKYEDDHIQVYHLKSKAASIKLYGGGVEQGKTNWCTAADSDNNPFDEYSKTGKLHVIHEKATGKKYQYGAEHDQFMDEHDNEIAPEDFKRIAPSLHAAWDKHPELTY